MAVNSVRGALNALRRRRIVQAMACAWVFRQRFAVSLAFGVLMQASPTRAATQDPATILSGEPMHIAIVHPADPACEPHCPEWIAAEGKILARSPGDFQKVLKGLGDRKLPVLINSQGGSVDAAIAIGRMIRRRGLDVGVARSQIEGCPGGDFYTCKTFPAGTLRGMPTSLRALCASACTLIFAGGAHRYAAPWSHVGVHQITTVMRQTHVLRQYRTTRLIYPDHVVETSRTLVKETRSSNTYVLDKPTSGLDRRIHAYLREMTGSEALVPLMAATPASAMHWMTTTELKDTNLATTPVGAQARALSPPAAGNAVIEDGTRTFVAPIEWTFAHDPADGSDRLTGRARFAEAKATVTFTIAATPDPKAPAPHRMLADIRIDPNPLRQGEPDPSSPFARFLVLGLSDTGGVPSETPTPNPFFPARSGDGLPGDTLATALSHLRDGVPVHALLRGIASGRWATLTFDPSGIRPALTKALAAWGAGPAAAPAGSPAASPAARTE